MEEEHIFTTNDLSSEETPDNKNGSGVNKVLVGAIVVLLLIITGGGAYFLGKRSTDEDNIKVTPTSSLFRSETLGDETQITPTSQPTASVSATVSPNLTPTITPKPSATPSPTLTPSPTTTPSFSTEY